MPIPISHVVLSQVRNGSCTPGLTNPAVCFECDYKGYLKYKIENLTGFYGPNTLWATMQQSQESDFLKMHDWIWIQALNEH